MLRRKGKQKMAKALTAKRVDQVNVGLVIISLALAVFFPYRGFLVAYAVLGPLHYLTELNWLHGRDYFMKNRQWIWIAFGGAFLVSFPKLVDPKYPTASWFPAGLTNAINEVDVFSNAFLFVTLLLAITFVLTKNRKIRLAALGVGVALGILLREVEFYYIFIGLLLPTLVHVYLFTLLFMYFGAKRSKSKWGYAALGMAVAAPVFIAFFDPANILYIFPEATKEMIVENNFHITNVLFGKTLSLTDGTSFAWYDKLFLRLQIFISFAYIYHYLNWFSKTSVIGWHKNLSVKKTSGIIVIWGIIVALFAIDYKLGFIAGLGLSFMHVMGEFPLNVITIKSLFAKG
ncbi:MAG TPA: hypothetical protein DCE41_07570 [Cytophagales bacterium]|nr:hypothetical protein [Cytophagales bacterium]